MQGVDEKRVSPTKEEAEFAVAVCVRDALELGVEDRMIPLPPSLSLSLSFMVSDSEKRDGADKQEGAGGREHASLTKTACKAATSFPRVASEDVTSRRETGPSLLLTCYYLTRHEDSISDGELWQQEEREAALHPQGRADLPATASGSTKYRCDRRTR